MVKTTNIPTRPRAFSLVELLVVIAVIAILTGLAVPAMKGLVGVSGVRGATNSLTTAFDQARFASIENSTPTYLGFPSASFSSASNPSLKFSSFIIFRERSPSEPDTDPQYKPLSRWIILPTGTMFDLSNASLDSTIGDAAAPLLPQLDGQDVVVEVIKFDKYGKVVSGEAGMSITVGNGILGSSGTPVFPNGNESETFVVQRLTGRVLPENLIPQQ
jgi:prepilin-type N-terminal cleavage/methylation domain-containing protein